MIGWLDWLTVSLIILPIVITIGILGVHYAEQHKPGGFMFTIVLGFYFIWQALLRISRHQVLAIGTNSDFYDFLNSSVVFAVANFLLFISVCIRVREQYKDRLEKIKEERLIEKRIRNATKKSKTRNPRTKTTG